MYKLCTLYRYELGRGIPVSIRSVERLQSGSTYTVYMDRINNAGRLRVSGQAEATGDDGSRFTQLNLYSDSRFVFYLGESIHHYSYRQLSTCSILL